MKLRSSSARASSSIAGAALALAAHSASDSSDQLDALFFKENQDLIDLLGVGVVVREMIVDLVVGQVALVLSGFEQGFQAVVDFLHQYHLASRPAARATVDASGKGGGGFEAGPHDISFGQLPKQFQGRRVIGGGLQLVLEFLFAGPPAALLQVRTQVPQR